ncbi:MAG TPA: hypothetical protein VM577_07310 [Anaerovoracaceae bacterium]|nr:hypothetical protein [Anaerovoracaceae bacterium]
MTNIDFDPFFEPLDPVEVSNLNELMEFISLAPYSTELEGNQILVKDKNGKLVMVLGDRWIEKP